MESDKEDQFNRHWEEDDERGPNPVIFITLAVAAASALGWLIVEVIA
jgi:hypothetical protein